MRINSLLLSALLLASTAHADKQCTSDELSFSFRDIDLRTAFSILADFSGHGLVFDESVAWSGPLNFTCVQWRQVLNDLAARHKLKVVIQDRTIYISK